MEKLCVNYGPLIGQLGDQKYYDFPDPSALTGPGVESHLRELGFGYRAKYIHQTARIVVNEREPRWLNSLRNPEKPAFNEKPATSGEVAKGEKSGYREAHEQLLALQGVGPKVADCVCLMGLGWGESVPVDTHGKSMLSSTVWSWSTHCIFIIIELVWQIAQRDYKFGKGRQKTLNKATYDAVGDHFRKLWGKEAGWAQSVLFTANLRSFSDRLDPKAEAHDQSSETLKVESKVEVVQVKEEVEGDGIRVTTRISVKRELSESEDRGPKVNINVSESAPKKRKTRASRSQR